MSFKYLLILLFLFAQQNLWAQKFTSTGLLLADFGEPNLVVNDTNLVNAVQTLFQAGKNPMASVLINAQDTTFYKDLRDITFISYPNYNWFEVTLFRVEPAAEGYNLKCYIEEKIPNVDFKEFVGVLTLPFRIVNNSIKFGNYFTENTLPLLLMNGSTNIYTTTENRRNLVNITSFVNIVRQNYKIKAKEDQRLFYLYYAEHLNPYKAVGLTEYALSHGGVTINLNKHDVIVFDKLNGGLFKHELTHFATSGFISNKFLSEGFASYLGGSGSKCDQRCDYEKLAELLAKAKNDSVFNLILERKYIPNSPPYGSLYYPLGSFTFYLLAKKYGNDFFMHEPLARLLSDKTTNAEIIAFLHSEFDQPGKTLLTVFTQELWPYSNTADGQRKK